MAEQSIFNSIFNNNNFPSCYTNLVKLLLSRKTFQSQQRIIIAYNKEFSLRA